MESNQKTPLRTVENELDENNPFLSLRAEESIDQALATIQENQVAFSQMADSKANIMITVCSLLVTISVTQLDDPTLKPPLLVFCFFASLSLIASIMTVIPQASESENTKQARRSKKAYLNPFFFMHFSALTVDEFEIFFEEAIRNPGKLYRNIARDIYFQGVILQEKKYRYLRWSYLSLLIGIGSSIFVTALGLLNVY